MTQKTPKNFEAAIARLEQIVEQLESGELRLEDSLKLFEEGVKLSRECQTQLQEAEQRVEKLAEDGATELSTSTTDQDSLEGF